MSNEEILEQNNLDSDEQATDEPSSDVTAELSIEELTAKLEEAEKKAADNWDQLIRTRAEMDNLRRRTQKDLENAHKFALEKFVSELLQVVDSLEMGLGTASQESASIDSLREGAEMTLNMFGQVMEKFNVQQIDPQDEKFNPEHHQAMSMQETAEIEANIVMAVMQKGYLLNERLVRPAMVMVSKAPATDNEN